MNENCFTKLLQKMSVIRCMIYLKIVLLLLKSVVRIITISISIFFVNIEKNVFFK